MTLWRRICCFSLTALLLLSALACAKDPEPVNTTTADSLHTTVATQDTTPTESTTLYADALPEDLDFENATITFLHREEISGDFYAETHTGDIVNDAIYESTLAVEERLNIDIQTVLRRGHTTDVRADYLNHVDQQILAGDQTYDWVDVMTAYATSRILTGNFLNLLSLENLDLKQPWYIANMEETIGIHNRLYFIAGDASLSYLKSAFCIYYNRDIAEEFKIEDLNKVVKDGKWTIERLIELTAQTAVDLNSDGVYNLDDQLGFISHDSNHRYGYLSSMGIQLYRKGEDGTRTFTFGTDHDYAACTQIAKLKNNTQGSYFFGASNSGLSNQSHYQSLSEMFIGNRTFMISAEIDDVIACGYHGMESTYGVLPYPKFNEEQENYATTSRTTHSVFVIPTTCADPERAAAVMEALSSTKYQLVLPTYFEVALKTKYSESTDTAEIFDLIHNSMVLDFGYVNHLALSNPATVYTNALDDIGSFASLIKVQEKSLNKKYETVAKTILEKCPE